MAHLRSGDFKIETYTRLTAVIKSRFLAIKTSVTTLHDQVNTFNSLQLKTLKAYKKEIDLKRADFDKNLQRALSHADSDEFSLETLTEDQNQIEELFIHISSIIEDVESTSEPQTLNNSLDIHSASFGNTQSTIRLPKFELCKFDGNLSNWTTFINLFDATIHLNSSLSNVVKFQYLLSVLTGEPFNLIHNLNLTDGNYVIAYELLKNRYQNDRRLHLMHLNTLLDLPNISHNDMGGIREFINCYNENMQALSAINCDIQDPNPLLMAVILRKMDVELRKKLESSRNTENQENHKLPTVKEIFNFLNKECLQHEDATFSMNTRLKDIHFSNEHPKLASRVKPIFKKTQPKFTTQCATSTDNRTVNLCAGCDQTTHKTYSCPIFLSKTPQERFQLVKNHQHCTSCLGMHDLKVCQSQSSCKTCHRKHNSLLHFQSGKSVHVPTQLTNKPEPQKRNHIYPLSTCPNNENKPVALSSQSCSVSTNTTNMVLLGTVLIKLRTQKGNTHVFRALLDSGSMCSLITEHAVNVLNVRRQHCDIQISGINQHRTRNKGQICLALETLSGHSIIKDHSLIILDKLTMDLPRMTVAPDVVQLTQEYNLADPAFHKPGRIDVILGAALFPYLFSGEQISLGYNKPHIINTVLGHVIMGTVPCIPQSDSSLSTLTQNSTLNVCLHSSEDINLHDSIQRFWTQEELPLCSIQSQEDVICEQHFINTHSRDDNGRYIVRLPFKQENLTLGTSRRSAELRLHSMERKFNTDNQFSVLYHNFMHEYLSLGHMTKCDDTPLPVNHYFLPHHGILKESSTTTKLRTVFDASRKTSSGVSLNDLLLTGRKLQTNIADILIHFRRHNIVFCCDIRQMYRQILIHPDDRKYQMILWRPTLNQPIDIYELNTVTYGVNSSPYIAIRTLLQLANDEGHKFPQAAHVLRNHMYVDDIITGTNTLEEALDLQNQVTSLLKLGGFELRKWISNSPCLLHNLPETHLNTPTFLSDSQVPQFTVLGLQWSPDTDTFSYTGQLIDTSINVTKRTVLSSIAKIYDPCGFLTPFIMLTKCFMQLIWTTGTTWDSPLPEDLSHKWTILMKDTHWLSHIVIPRSLNLHLSQKVELHGFCDASESGYAAVIYFRCEQPNNVVTVSLIIAKSRVAPLKRVTIPRLELCAAHLLAKLVAHCKSLFHDHITNDNIHLWSDSTITLSWLCTPPYRLKTYVANRVSQIQELIPSEAWKHISSEHNPADCASRGLLLAHLVNQTMWWNGPPWLTLPPCDWPTSNFTTITLDSSHEVKANPLPILFINEHNEWPILTKWSSWTKLQNIMAWILRFVYNCRNKIPRKGDIHINELKEAQRKIFFSVQQSTFSAEFASLTRQTCPKHFLKLNPFIDSDQLIRVGGRLRKAALPHDVKHPILLPKRHHVVEILIDHYHIKSLHAGPQLVQSLLSQHVWIMNARNTIRLRIHNCITCFKHHPVNTNPFMADLPPVRTSPSKPFTSTGVDYGGPYSVKVTNLRFIKHIKVYLCVFICMVTKAVHLEVVTDLTTDAFIAALTRFISRRGICSDIYSDCGTNFTSANTVLKKIIKSTIHNADSQHHIQRFSLNHDIKFHFNPPAAPHHGGLWESAIKSAKHHLHRVMGDTILTLPEFITLTTRIEAMLNSRPLTPLSSDPSDLTTLTPGHFLTGGPLMALPEPDLSEVPSNRLKHWQLLQQLFQRLWNRWSLEYLHTLQQRNKWNVNSPNLKIGDLVLVHSASSPICWPLARVVETFPGTDGVVRVAKIKTQNNTYMRPTTKLFLLPTQ